jgi:hypothetical protein
VPGSVHLGDRHRADLRAALTGTHVPHVEDPWRPSMVPGRVWRGGCLAAKELAARARRRPEKQLT